MVRRVSVPDPSKSREVLFPNRMQACFGSHLPGWVLPQRPVHPRPPGSEMFSASYSFPPPSRDQELARETRWSAVKNPGPGAIVIAGCAGRGGNRRARPPSRRNLIGFRVKSPDSVCDPAGIIPVRIFRPKFHRQQTLRIFRRLSLRFEFNDTRLYFLEVSMLLTDQRGITYLAVSRHNFPRLKGFQLIQDHEPVFSVRICIGKDWEKTIERHIPREEDSIFLDENKAITPRVRRSKPKQPSRHPAQVEFYFMVENDIGRTRFDVLQ